MFLNREPRPLDEPVGVGGWLLWLCISLTILSPLGILAIGFSEMRGSGDAGSAVLELLYLGLAVYSLVTGVRLWRVRPNAHRQARIFLAVNLALGLLSLLLEGTSGMTADQAGQLGRGVITPALWLLYLFRSRRVHNTFDRLPAAEAGQAVPPAPPPLPLPLPLDEADDLPRLEAMTFGMVLDRAFHLYTANFPRLFGITAVAQLLGWANFWLLRRLTSLPFAAPLLPGIVAGALLAVLLPLASGAAVTTAAAARYRGERLTVAQAYRTVLRRLGPLTGAWAVATLLILVTTPLLLVFAVYLYLSFCLITPVVMLEGLPAARSRRRARQLIKGSRWRALGLLALLAAGSIVLVLVLSSLVMLLSSLALQTAAGTVASQVVMYGLVALLQPLGSLILLMLYYDQRIRQEGYDLALLAESVAAQ